MKRSGTHALRSTAKHKRTSTINLCWTVSFLCSAVLRTLDSLCTTECLPLGRCSVALHIFPKQYKRGANAVALLLWFFSKRKVLVFGLGKICSNFDFWFFKEILFAELKNRWRRRISTKGLLAELRENNRGWGKTLSKMISCWKKRIFEEEKNLTKGLLAEKKKRNVRLLYVRLCDGLLIILKGTPPYPPLWSSVAVAVGSDVPFLPLSFRSERIKRKSGITNPPNRNKGSVDEISQGFCFWVANCGKWEADRTSCWTKKKPKQFL